MAIKEQVNWRNVVLPRRASIRDAIRCLDEVALQIAIIVDSNGSMVGTITDGDIRRALLRGDSLDVSVDQIMCREFRALPENATDEEAIKIMRNETLRQIPALDDQGKVVRLFLLEELVRPMRYTNPVVIMAGGEGKRLHPLTQDCPKPMLRVGGKPLLEIILEQCINAGFQNFYFSINYLKSQIQDYFGDGSHWNVNIDYLEEERPLGTGGALSLLRETPIEPFLLINGDLLTRVDYTGLLRFHDEQKAAATICVREHTTKIPYGVVRMDDANVLGLEEKPLLSHYVNAGIYLLDPLLLDLVPQNQFFDMPQLLEKAILQEHRVSAFPIHEYWLDVGEPDTFKRAHHEWEK